MSLLDGCSFDLLGGSQFFGAGNPANGCGFSASCGVGWGPAGAWGGPPPWIHEPAALQLEEARYNSILTTGWDPELGRWEWGWHSLGTDLSMAMANQNCSSLLGGPDAGSGLITNMAFTDPGTAAAILNLSNPAPSPLDPAYMDWYLSQMAPLEIVAGGLNYALTMIAPSGKFLGYVTGPSFASLSTARQMTVMIHEFYHAAGKSGELSPALIGQACGTSIPPSP